MHQLLDVSAGADLVVVLDVAAHDAALVGHVLDPVDELVPAAGELAPQGVGGGAGEDEHRHPAAHGVGDRAAHVLGARVHVHDHGGGAAGDERVGVGGAERDDLMRADDDPGKLALPAFGPRLRQGLDEAGMVAAEVGVDVGDTRLGQRLEERGARRAVALGHR